MDRVYVMELVRSFQCGLLTRREFRVRTTIALGSLSAADVLLAGCAPARGNLPPVVAPASAAAPPATPATAGTREKAATPSGETGLVTGTVEYPGPGGQTLMGYLARPEDGEPRPAVVVLQEWWGLDEHIKDVTRRFASEGFVALAPDLYHGRVTTEPDEARKLVMELDMGAAIGEIRRAIDFLLAQEYVAGEKAGIVGFCMGGRLGLRTARVEEKLGAAVAFYGAPLTAQEAAEVKAPILGLYGEEDAGIPIANVRAMEEALKRAGVEIEIEVYPGAGHAFFNDTRQSYDKDAAADAWQRTLAWFRAHLRGRA